MAVNLNNNKYSVRDSRLYSRLINCLLLNYIFEETLDKQMASNLTKHRRRLIITISWLNK